MGGSVSKQWLDASVLGSCDKCNSADIEAFNESITWFNNGTPIRCNTCGNKGETMAYSSEDVAIEWGHYND